jgi:hypothetical protein
MLAGPTGFSGGSFFVTVDAGALAAGGEAVVDALAPTFPNTIAPATNSAINWRNTRISTPRHSPRLCGTSMKQ